MRQKSLSSMTMVSVMSSFDFANSLSLSDLLSVAEIYVHFQRDYPRSVDEGVGVVELFLFVGTEDESMTCSYDFDFTVSVITAQGTARTVSVTSFFQTFNFSLHRGRQRLHVV